ncbi:MAG: patatin-like phospholipase family protein [Alicyclobacillaceae bacterium]|nr:patatin-like phospholipase family protein [Alicyclobacillaceae bacterium]
MPKEEARTPNNLASGVNLALGGGAARGLAHIGVLRAFEREGVPIAGIAGCSMGALVAAAYAAGALERLEKAALDIRMADLIKFADFAFFRGGLIQGDRISEQLRTLIGDVEFRDLRMPVAVVATDLRTGETVVLRDGSLTDAVRASISVPGLFAPVHRGARLLVDGGVSNRVPSDVARTLSPALTVAVDVGSARDTWTVTATFARVRLNRLRSLLQEARDAIPPSPLSRALEIIGVLGGHPPEPRTHYGLLRALFASIDVLEAQLAAQQDKARTADWVLHPDVEHIDAHRFDRAREAIAAGEAAAQRLLRELSVC